MANYFLFFTGPRNKYIDKKVNTEKNDHSVVENRKDKYVSKLEDPAPEKDGFLRYDLAAYWAVARTCGGHVKCVAISDAQGESQKLLQDTLDYELNGFSDAHPAWAFFQKNDDADTILQRIQEQAPLANGDTVYLAINGGVRHLVMFLSVFMEIMKAKGVKVKLIYVADGKPQEILDVTDENSRYFDILRGVELFTKTGNPQQLMNCYSGKYDTLFKLMQQFYYGLQLCRPVSGEGMTATYQKMMKQLNDLESQENTDTVMKLMIPEIRRRFQPRGEQAKSFLQILTWCKENGMILQGYFIMTAEFSAYWSDWDLSQMDFIKAEKTYVTAYDDLKKYYADIEKNEQKLFSVFEFARLIRNGLAHSDEEALFLNDSDNRREKKVSVYKDVYAIWAANACAEEYMTDYTYEECKGEKYKLLKEYGKNFQMSGDDLFDRLSKILERILDLLEKI